MFFVVVFGPSCQKVIKPAVIREFLESPMCNIEIFYALLFSNYSDHCIEKYYDPCIFSQVFDN